MVQTLFAKYGGSAEVSKLVYEFYKKVLQDKSVSLFFKGTDLDQLIAHQTSFLSRTLGGPDQCKGKDLHTSHASLNIIHAEYMVIANYLKETFIEPGIEKSDICAIMILVNDLEGKVVTKKAA
jgi:hemoglobin